MKFCLGVTLYNPSIYELNSLLSLEKVFDKIYIFDNSEGELFNSNSIFFKEYKNISYIGNNKNDGLSIAYNEMCSMSISDGFDFICLLDQDSKTTVTTLKFAINYIKKQLTNKVAVYAPEIIYSHKSEISYKKQKNYNVKEIAWAISSGSFINLKLYKDIYQFDENYFIDRLDYDYCYTMRTYGFKIIRIKNYVLYQSLGEEKKVGTKLVSQHNPLRHYYISRNRLFFYIKKYKKIFILKYALVFLLSLRHLYNVIFHEDLKIQKINMIIKGYIDFSRGYMGKLEIKNVDLNNGMIK